MKIENSTVLISYERGVETSRLWLNNDFGPVGPVNEVSKIYHVVLSGDTSKMC